MKSQAIKCLVTVLCSIVFFVSQLPAGSWQEFPVFASTNYQQSPDIDGSIVVWQEDFGLDGGYGWDICGSNITDPAGENIFYVPPYDDDQIAPAVSGNIVVFRSFVQTDYDLWAADVNDIEAIYDFPVSQQIDIDEQRPAIHGNTVVWTDDRYTDARVFGADIHNRDSIVDFLVTPFLSDQTAPAIYRNRVVCESNYFGDWDIMSADIWRRDDPQEYPVLYDVANQQNPAISENIVAWQDDIYGDFDIFAADSSNPDSPELFSVAVIEGSQENPDLDGNIIVWQDNWSGNWDIYGYNITTGQEFVICDNEFDQINPAISGNTVVWEDYRGGNPVIYAAVLDGPEIADCQVNQPGDLNGDCSVNMADLSIIASNWMECGLTVQQACNP